MATSGILLILAIAMISLLVFGALIFVIVLAVRRSHNQS